MPDANTPTPHWPADHRERVPIESLTPYLRNARTHSDAQIAQVAASMKRWGWTIPVLVDEAGGVIAGHARIAAAKTLGYAEVPVMRAIGWSEDDKRAYVIADNKLALNSEWDMDLLSAELGDLQSAGASIAEIGFTGDELAALFGISGGGGSDAPGGGVTGAGTLALRFGVPPFTVLNAREGWWQERKAAWLGLGIRSEIGRGENLIGHSLHSRIALALGAGDGDTAYERARKRIEAEREKLGDSFDAETLLVRVQAEAAAKAAAKPARKPAKPAEAA